MFEKAIQFKPFPKLQTQIAGTKLPRSFQAHLVKQNAGYLRIIRRRLDMRRKQLQLFRFTLSLKTSMVFNQRACAEPFSSPK